LFSLQDKKTAEKIISKIKKSRYKPKIMHVCGTHQDTILKNGLDHIFQESKIQVTPGPGCPVCVTTPREIEKILTLARSGLTITTFGDMMNVPGEKKSLRDLKTEGYDIRTVYGIEDAVLIAEKNPDKEIVFMAVGFETTAPSTAAVIHNEPPTNFSVLCCHRTMPNALRKIVEMGEIKIDGIIEPGHVSTIIGTKPYRFLSEEYKIPQVITGFEPLDVLAAVWMIIKQIENNKSLVENEYSRVVKETGNIKAQRLIQEVFTLVDKKWRGFPEIPKSALKIRDRYQKYDAEIKYEKTLEEIKRKEYAEPQGCRCGELLRGLITPHECPLFGKRCKPETPVGPCMVSSEGSCNIEYRYHRKK